MEPPPPPPLSHTTYTLTASTISYAKPAPTFLFKPCSSTPPTNILNNVSLTAHPSEILAIVGPSGAGKSTLLDILAARTAATTGALLLNSAPLNPSAYRKLSAYVPQHDACLPLLTVAETFAFSAALLNPKSANIPAIVSALLDDLRLTHLAQVRLAHGLSGGERRRVSIGLSLLHDPAVLLLDEPTSGLDSRSALSIMQTLRSVTETRRRTVVLSIHQPSFKILSTIDRILLLAQGSVVHHGTLSSLEDFLLSNGFTVPPQLNPLEYAMEILNQLQSPPPPPPPPPPPIESGIGDTMRSRYRSSRIHEITLLYLRFWKIIYRTKQLLVTNTLQALGVGIILGTIYINIGLDKSGMEKRFGLFAFTLTFLLSSTTETLPIFINERPILLREASSGVYRLSSHLIANTLVFLPYLLAIAVVYSVSVYFLVGLCMTWQAFTYFVVVIWSIVLMANSFVLFLSSVAPNFIAGTSLLTLLLAGFFLFSGYFISRDRLPKFWLFMHYISMYKYALDALLINEYSCLLSTCLVWYDKGSNACMINGRDFLERRGLHERQRWTNVYVMIGFFLLYRLLCFMVLIRRVSRSKK
ncbi:ABC transporter G family member 8-like [Salvia miltiorrhiza]|uniref:ABC transporter G family member 8-like n=1 Tax=Salvia miltiorrhiza TaxID=226208 RepID=UPI0025AD679B|nr:ABC transporter G family member 8-like [Salvia miltiorrhiza]